MGRLLASARRIHNDRMFGSSAKALRESKD